MSNTIKIGIVDDHLLVRRGTISLLKEFEQITVLFDVGNGKEALEQLKTHKPDIILLDIEMPIMDGTEAFEKIKKRHPNIKVIMVTTHYKDSYIIKFVKNGAAGFLSKNTGIEKIVEAITTVKAEGYYFDEAIRLIMSKAIPDSTDDSVMPRPDLNLTGREVIIIRLICLRKSTNDIAEKLFVSVRTIEGHRLHIRQKTKCKNSLDLITYSIQNNLLSIS